MVRHRQRMVTGVTDCGSEFTMWWSGTASINLSVILSRRWSLNTSCHSGQPLFTRPWLCFWETLIRPPPSTDSPPVFFRSPSLLHQLLSQLYKLSLFSLLFPQLQLWLWEKEGGEGGKHAKRCGIFLSFLAPMAIRHKALCPFLHAFSPPSALLLKASFFYLHYEKPF